MYSISFRTKKFVPDKYILELEQKQNICRVKFVDYHDKRIYSEGYLICNDENEREILDKQNALYLDIFYA